MGGVHCRIYKKPLSDFTSIKFGMGPVCRARYNLQCELGLEDHAQFLILKTGLSFILIKDTGHYCHKTITNDVSFVMNQLKPGRKRVFYIDSENSIDEIVHREGIFLGFKVGHEGIEL
jgi:hypothetical protein